MLSNGIVIIVIIIIYCSISSHGHNDHIDNQTGDDEENYISTINDGHNYSDSSNESQYTLTENSNFHLAGEDNSIYNTAQCVLKLSAKYFVEKRALSGSIVIININSYSSTTQQILLKTIHSGIKYSVMVKDSFYPHRNASHFPEKAKNYMLILDEIAELNRNILQLNKLPTWNPHAKAVIFYELRSKENGTAIAVDIINELRDYKLFKSIVFIYSPDVEEVVTYTWSPYSDSNCGGKCESIYILDKCKFGETTQYSEQLDVFPSDMNGCPLIVNAVVAEPYVMPPVAKLNNTYFDDAYIFDLGIEINIVKIIAQFTNMTLIVRMSSQPENWGSIDVDGSATGAYSILRNDSTDLIIGNMQVDKILRKWFDSTNTFMQDEITWCVPKAGPASTLANLVTIFQWSTWAATFASLIMMSLIFHIFYYRENLLMQKPPTKWPTNSILMTFSMLLGWGALFNARTVTFRVIIFTWLIFSINVSISYQSFLRSFLIHPRYEKQVSNEAGIINSGLSVGGRDTYKSNFINNNASSFYIYRKYKSLSFAEAIERTAFERDFALVSSKRQADYQDGKLGKGAKLIYCFGEGDNLYKYGVVLLARKWFPMLNRFNIIIRSVSENGLIWKWNNELFIHSTSGSETSDIVPLGMQHLLGAFLFIGFMYAICITVFFGELLFDWVCKTYLNRNYRKEYID